MNKVAEFKKVSWSEFSKSGLTINQYNKIILPKRATVGSAGYDFYSPISIELKPGESYKVPTGIRVRIDNGWVLCIFPRSSLGFKFRLQLDNTTGIIDSDYFNALNEGHIFIKITNDSKEGKSIIINENDAFAQGIFFPFGITTDDDTEGVRTGGFGSTNKKNSI